MKEIDALSRLFLSDPQVFADICNIHYFQGRTVVLPGNLSACPVAVSSGPGRRKKDHVFTGIRDVLKRCVPGPSSPELPPEILLGFEAQSKPDPRMALRVHFYNSLTLLGQITEMEQSGAWDGFPGGRWAAKLVPVRTLVVYFGLEPWDVPTGAAGLLEHPDTWPGRPPDYTVDVLSLAALDDGQLEGRCPSLQCVARCLRNGLDKEALRKMFREDELFSRVPNSVVDLVNAILHTNIRKSRNKETTDMSRKIEGIWVDVRAEGEAIGEARGRAEGEAIGEARGEARGRAETIRDFVRSSRKSRMSRKRILASLERHFSLKGEEAMSFLL